MRMDAGWELVKTDKDESQIKVEYRWRQETGKEGELTLPGNKQGEEQVRQVTGEDKNK